MSKINFFKHDGIEVPLSLPADIEDNTYSVIVGKNGVGKSRLLSSMARAYKIEEETSFEEFVITRGQRKSIPLPKVIAISTSPFDRFPLPRRNIQQQYINNYRYVGIRSIGSSPSSSAITLISSATKGIIEKYLIEKSNHQFLNVFDALGFDSTVRLTFKTNFKYGIRQAEEARSRRFTSPDMAIAYSEIVHWLENFDISVSEKINEQLINLHEEEANEIIHAISTIGREIHERKNLVINLDFSSREKLYVDSPESIDLDRLSSLHILFKYDLIKLMDLGLNKKNHGPLSLRRASSGEQCMLMIMLGVAGHISDNSLIFIDEPEISLHPKWQEEFMPMLINTFSKYKNCQFFIATHSPQIISNVNDNNCYVTSLTKNEIFPASFFKNRSSDFQLTELFDAPGYRNEYISRLAFSLLAKVKKQRTVGPAEREALEKLLGFVELIEKDDPIYELILSINEVVDFYASNK